MSDRNIEGKFVIKKVTKFSELVEGQTLEIPESDLCFQNENTIVQLSYVKPEDTAKYEIKPGIYTLEQTSAGISTAKTDIYVERMLESIDNTSKIIGEARKFFSRIDAYERRGRIKKRGVLLYSKPGCGKSSAIKKFCTDFVKEDPGTVVFMWPTSSVEADSITAFLSTQSEYVAECTRLVLIIEDIGGGERTGERGPAPVESGLLNLLDGVGVTFKLPTFIIATTNHPENLLESLADRPGRFDLMLELAPPNLEERIALLEFIEGRELNAEEKMALARKGAEDFSIAHLNEIVVRADLDGKSIPDVVQELIEHSKRFDNAFQKKRTTGF
jgi:hypothetical protein